MRSARHLAEHTPATRERFVDLLRAVAIAAVVLGHWLISVIEYDGRGNLTGHSALRDLPWAHPITWLVQVMPLFFLAGGFANAASLTAHRARGGDAVGWLQARAARLIRPTTVLLVVLAGAAAGSQLFGAEPNQARTAVWFASIPLWFLSAYLTVVALAPLMYALHERFGLAVPLVLVGLVALGDLARLHDWTAGKANFVFGWLAIHQVGFAWRTERAGPATPGRGPIRAGRLPSRPRVAVPLLVGGLAATVVLTVAGPYPVTMVDVPGERLHNMSPPTLALLALATAQLGLVLLLRDPTERWLRRPGPWRVVVSANAVILTIFLWHISAVLLVSGALAGLGLLPTPGVGSTAWWLWRILWLLMLLVVLAALVAVFGRFETRGTRRPATRPRWLPAGLARALTRRPEPRLLLTGAGFAGTIYGLLGNNLAPKTGHYPFGLPTGALVAYLAGAGVLRLLGSVPGGDAAPRRPGTALVSSGSENPD